MACLRMRSTWKAAQSSLIRLVQWRNWKRRIPEILEVLRDSDGRSSRGEIAPQSARQNGYFLSRQ